MKKLKDPYDLKQRLIQKIYRENLKKKKTVQNEKRNILFFIACVFLGLIIFAVIEQLFL
ncbi:hypothetical protein ACWM35_17280 [Neobacillus sp. K501]